MKFEDLKCFELNNEVIKDFDQIMGMHLDLVEELVFNEEKPASKLFNIASLCINVKKLVIKSNTSLNINSIFTNICKPESLEEITFDHVKFPNLYLTKKLTGLKSLKIVGAEKGKVKEFLSYIPYPNFIEKIAIENSDIESTSDEIFKEFKNIREITLENVKNLNLTHCDALEGYKNLERLKLISEVISIDQIKYLAKLECKKEIKVTLLGLNKGKIVDNFEIKEGKNVLKINSKNIDKIFESECLPYIGKIDIYLNDKEDVNMLTEYLHGYRGESNLFIKDMSYLSAEDAEILHKNAGLKEISILAQDEKTVKVSYKVEEYKAIFDKISEMILSIEFSETQPEKFLRIYDLICTEFTIDDNYVKATGNLEDLYYELESKLCLSSNLAIILNNFLQFSGFESRLENGTIKKSREKRFWNQVKIDDNWYNIDIVEDYKRLKNKRGFARVPKYCLVSDKKFLDTHLPLSGDHKYCIYDFDSKVLKIFFRTGRYDNKYFESIVRVLFRKFKKSKVKMLPEGENKE